MRSRRTSHGVLLRPSTLLAVGVAVVALAACGSSGSSSKSSSKTKSTAAPSSSTSTGSSADVKTASTSLGTILVDSSGRTLYTLTNGGSAVPCTGQCLTFWPPAMLPSGATSATGGSGVAGLATMAANGGKQITAGGLPLYRYSGDMTAGATNGEAISSFGGVWHVVKVGAGASGGTTGGATSSTTGGSTTSSGGSGGSSGY